MHSFVTHRFLNNPKVVIVFLHTESLYNPKGHNFLHTESLYNPKGGIAFYIQIPYIILRVHNFLHTESLDNPWGGGIAFWTKNPCVILQGESFFTHRILV